MIYRWKAPEWKLVEPGTYEFMFFGIEYRVWRGCNSRTWCWGNTLNDFEPIRATSFAQAKTDAGNDMRQLWESAGEKVEGCSCVLTRLYWQGAKAPDPLCKDCKGSGFVPAKVEDNDL